MEQEVHQIILAQLSNLERKIDAIHSPSNCPLGLKVDSLQKQISYWAGGLAVLMFIIGVFVAFKG